MTRARASARAALLVALLLVGALACGRLEDGGGAASEDLCPLPCPASCPQSCLPSGYCDSLVLDASSLSLGPRAADGHWQIAASGFPPGASLQARLHLGGDIAERDGRSPIWTLLGLVEGADIAYVLQLDALASSFPIWSDAQVSAVSDADGGAAIELTAVVCNLVAGGESVEGHCVLDGASTFTFSLVDPSPWSKAPPCP